MSNTLKKGRTKTAGRYHHGDLREMLLQTALRSVEEQGVGALNLRELARRVGVSHAAPAHHFPDKTALLVALAIEGFGYFAQSLQEAADAEKDPTSRLAAVGRAYVDFGLAHPGYFRVMFSSQLADLEGRPAELDEAGLSGYRILKQCTADLAGGKDQACVQQITLTAWSVVHGIATLYVVGPMRSQLETKRGRHKLKRWLDSTLLLVAQGLAR